GYLSIINGKFGEFQQERPNVTDNVIDFSGKYIAPGLVDTHIHCSILFLSNLNNFHTSILNLWLVVFSIISKNHRWTFYSCPFIS
ncbi:hypothetical protein ACTPEF_26105, partial [Clostridioides difficile]